MTKNMGTIDRVGRGVLAAAALAGSGLLGFGGVGGVVLIVVAGVMGVTAATGFCPLYTLVGIRTTAPKGTAAEHGGGRTHLHRAA